MNETFLVFLLGHLLADYTLQSESLALSKRSSRKSLLLHLVIHGRYLSGVSVNLQVRLVCNLFDYC